MSDPLDALARHGNALLFAAVFIEQVGVPIPSAPVVIAAGVLVAGGRMNLPEVLAIVLAASLSADWIWYLLGKRYGARVLGFLCRVSIEPDSCVRNTEDGFAQHGPWLIVSAKFVPGLSAVTPPLAAMVGIGAPRFLALDALGTLTQTLILVGAGWVLHGPFGRLGRWLAASGARAPLVLGTALLAYVAWRCLRRWRVLRDLRMARVTPPQLKARLDAGESVFIVDLRHRVRPEAGMSTIPGALRMQPDELEARHAEIPRDRDVVLFCT
jgi:membrane protein DedA with SNARE-associated domain